MNEEELKKLIAKSKVETSDDFLNNLMLKVEKESKSKTSKVFEFSSKRIVIQCGLLIVVISFLAHNFLNGRKVLDIVGKESITPLFVIILGVLLFTMNHFIRTIESSKIQNKSIFG